MDLEWSCFLITSLVCRPFDHQTGLQMVKNMSFIIYLLWPFYAVTCAFIQYYVWTYFWFISFIEQYFLFSNPFKFCSATYNNGDNLFKKQQIVQQAPPTKKKYSQLFSVRSVSLVNTISFDLSLCITQRLYYPKLSRFKNCPNFFFRNKF